MTKIVIRKLEDDRYRKELRTTLGDERYGKAVIEQLLHEYDDDIFRQCVRWLGPVDGEEVAQETFLQAWQSLPRYRGDSAIKTWLLGIVKNECRKFLRNRSRRKRASEARLPDIRERVHPQDPASPEDQLVIAQEQDAERQQIARLTACIKRLPDTDRLLVTWRYLRGIPVAEIGDLLEEKQDTIYKRLKRALQKLNKCMTHL